MGHTSIKLAISLRLPESIRHFFVVTRRLYSAMHFDSSSLDVIFLTCSGVHAAQNYEDFNAKRVQAHNAWRPGARLSLALHRFRDLSHVLKSGGRLLVGGAGAQACNSCQKPLLLLSCSLSVPLFRVMSYQISAKRAASGVGCRLFQMSCVMHTFGFDLVLSLVALSVFFTLSPLER